MGLKSLVGGAAGGGAILGGGGALTGGALGGALGFGGAKNLLFGKKDKGRAAGYLGLDPSLAAVVEKARKEQARSIDIYGQELKNLGKVDAEAAAKREQARRINLAKGLGESQRRKVEAQLARTGAGNTARGLRALMGAENETLSNIQNVRADMPQIMQQQQMDRIQRLSALTGGLGTTLSTTGAPGTTRAYDPGRKGGGRSGGLLGLGLGIAGAAYSAKKGGNPASGFGAGMGAGQAFSNLG